MTSRDRSVARAHAATEWAELRDRLRTVTPQAVGRAALTVAAALAAVRLAQLTWPALLPFIVGGLIAYQLLPLVDALDRMMPRVLAALISVTAAVAAVVAVVILILPPLAIGFVQFAVDLPTGTDIDRAVADFQGRVGNLPEGSQAVVVPVVTALASTVRDALSGAAGNFDDIVRTGVAALLNAVGALLGLIVLPTWMLVLMREKHRARRAIDSRITPGLRTDVWALVAIVDRAAGAYLRGYVVTAFIVGALAWVGLSLSPAVGGPRFPNPLPVAVFAGVSQVVPVVGPILGLLPSLLVLTTSPDRAAAYLLIYVAAKLIGGQLVGARLMGRRIGVHPAILVPGVVLIGQFGVLWLLLSAPIVAIVADLVRYVHGRLSEPPKPAGLLPGEPVGSAALAARGRSRVPSVYRPATAPRPITTTPGSSVPASQT